MTSKFISLSKDDINVGVKVLNELLANTYILSVKTQNFHWNVQDSRFYMLHDFFSDKYNELSEAVDEIAERIRMLGEHVPGAMAFYLKLGCLEEAEIIKDGDLMLRALTKDHNIIITALRTAIEQVSQTEDQGTLDFLISRLQYHEKIAWMTSSHYK